MVQSYGWQASLYVLDIFHSKPDTSFERYIGHTSDLKQPMHKNGELIHWKLTAHILASPYQGYSTLVVANGATVLHNLTFSLWSAML